MFYTVTYIWGRNLYIYKLVCFDMTYAMQTQGDWLVFGIELAGVSDSW